MGQRAEFQPVVTLMPFEDLTSQCGVSAEIFDGATGLSLVAAWPPTPIMPNVSPLFGMAGIALGRTRRLNVVGYPPNPCDATIGFLNNAGQPPANASAKTVSLNPGQADFVDLRAASVGIGVGQRAEFQPVVMVSQGPNGSASACQATAEVFETLSGRTWAWWPPTPVTPSPSASP